MSDRDIEACIVAIKNGDTNAFELIIDRYQNAIYKYVRYIVYNQCDIDDIVQEVFIKIYSNLYQYKTKTNFEGWIYKIAYNHTMTTLKKKSKEPLIFMEEVPDTIVYDEEKSELSPEVKKVMSNLKPEERAVLFLRINEGLSYKEISKITKKNESLLRKKYERTKSKFINSYEEVTNDETRAI